MKTKTTFLVMLLIWFVQLLQSQDFITEWTFPYASSQIQFNALTADGPVNYTWSTSTSGNNGEGSFTSASPEGVTLGGLTIVAGDVVTLAMAPTNLRRSHMSYGIYPILTNVTQWGGIPWSNTQIT